MSTKLDKLQEEMTISLLMMMVSAIRTTVVKFGKQMRMTTELVVVKRKSENSARVTRRSTRSCSIQV
jgi:hypothetical protein